MKMSWVTIDRFCREEAQVNEDIRRVLEHNVLAGAGRSSRNAAVPRRSDEGHPSRGCSDGPDAPADGMLLP